MKKRLKELRRREMTSRDIAEADAEFYATLFPSKLSLSEVLLLFSALPVSFVIGSYLLVGLVFWSLQSNVVGLHPSEYLNFATYHVTWEVILSPLLFIVCYYFGITAVKRAYISNALSYGHFGETRESRIPVKNLKSFTRAAMKAKSFTSVDAIYYSLCFGFAALHIPAIMVMSSKGNELVNCNVVWPVLIVDVVLIIKFFLDRIPYMYLLKHGIAIYFTSIFSLVIVTTMCFKGYSLARELRSATSSEWQYVFSDGVVTSSEYSYVYEGSAYFIFYKREGEEFVLKKVVDVQGFSGTL